MRLEQFVNMNVLWYNIDAKLINGGVKIGATNFR